MGTEVPGNGNNLSRDKPSSAEHRAIRSGNGEDSTKTRNFARPQPVYTVVAMHQAVTTLS
ncbi:hypothetical protein Taro_038965 [Colocasia esculenta]|uniref:Uncharacterized protein n=1 Tax=Colocasia esculenta TaxID=4460 RepID=A0A843WNR9_COLES|nr:hypothetical protein [Colocasia esculenta]